ncbi:tetratricopeptide repeat protein [Nitrosomonas sp. Nm84]|uniref:tetratricopeptide repeat protein n=1 Tax=Nitrosomonas sp. Nm84 TaxID=200124 RepID=UPI000D75DAE2|nr:tetratricopeptide repeat protein [Nitrosomonas sp. Nm84]PXW89758.1 tetratricopeptide repeat protein [Nitrosomonas sp. Nm84]
MFKIKQLSWMVGCTLALNGCAFIQKDASFADIEIKPVMNIKHANGSPKIMYLLGRYYQGKIDYQRAIAAYARALEEKPDYVEVHNGLGVIYSIQGRYELSLQHFHKAIEISPKETYLYNNLGYAYLTQGNEAEAVKSLEKALLLDPENERARLNLAVAHERIDLTDKTASLQAASVNPPPPVMHETIQANLKEPHHHESVLNDTSDSKLTHTSPHIYEYKAKKSESLVTVSSEQTSQLKDSSPLDNKAIRIEVSNGNGMTGMARQVSVFFQQYGHAGARLTNHQTYNQYQTEIYYQPGNYQQAYQINQMLPKQVKLVESNKLRNDIQVKILLGQDYSREITHFSRKDQIQISQNSEQSIAKAIN